MKADQVEIFREYTLLRKDSPESKRVEYLETLLVRMNQGLIYHVARRYPSIWNYPSEIKAVGMATLLVAIRTYEPEKGPLAAHAEWKLRSSEGLQSIQRFHASGPIKIPHNAYVDYLSEKKRLSKEPESKMSDEGLAVEIALNGIARFGEENREGPTLEDSIEQQTFTGQYANLERVESTRLLNKVIESLEPREKRVIRLLFGMEENQEKHDLRTIGDKLSISHTMVCKIRDKALDRLRKRLTPMI